MNIDKLSLSRALNSFNRDFLRQLERTYKLSFQETRSLIIMTLDFQMWGITKLEEYLGPAILSFPLAPASRKKVIQQIRDEWQGEKEKGPQYCAPKESTHKRRAVKVSEVSEGRKIFGRCPVYSEKTRCCNLLTIDVVESCAFDCSYCSIQSFYTEGEISYDPNLREKLKTIESDPDFGFDKNKIYHFGTGQSSDSLFWNNRFNELEALFEFAHNNPNVILELKTKSDKIDYLLKVDIPANVIITWSLAPQRVIDHEEQYTASLEQRLQSAMALVKKDALVGFHFHPLIMYEQFDDDINELAKRMKDLFPVKNIAMVSLGTLTFSKNNIKKIRARAGLHSSIFKFSMVESAGKMTYPDEIKKHIFKSVFQSFSSWSEDVFFYLCMEKGELWKETIGREYHDNATFEAEMNGAYMKKINELRARRGMKSNGLI